VEQYDAIWDDGVAPEVTLDFDCQHIDSGEALVRVYIRRVFLCWCYFLLTCNITELS
jgi:hypothetical protein